MTTPAHHDLSAAQQLIRRLRVGWSKVRRMPLPRYRKDTPQVGGGNALDPHFRPTAATLGAAAMSREAADFVLNVLDRLTPVEALDVNKFAMRLGPAKFGTHWRSANLLTAAWAAATLIRPQSYLEIGVWRGRSVAVVGAVWPKCNIYGFDLWIPDYGGAPNPGSEFVEAELRGAGHSGHISMTSGDSRKTVPQFLREHPDLYFDMVTFDGDKTILGCGSDFANVLPRLKIGGIVLFDDMPPKPSLRRVWNKIIRGDSRYVTWEFAEGGEGVAITIRISE